MPPENEADPSAMGSARANQQISHNTTARNDTRSGRQQPYDRLAGNARWYGASRRSTPLGSCGCVRAPDYDRHRCDGEISDHMAEAAATALLHLDQLGAPGLLDARTCRAMWRIGHRRLAVAVHARTSGGA